MLSKNKILIATSNTDRYRKMKRIVESIDNNLMVKSLQDTFEQGIVKPEENGNSELENAILKAKYYGSSAKMVTLSFDNGIYLVDPEPTEQIGHLINRYKSNNLTKKEVFLYWQRFIEECPTKPKGYLRRVSALYLDKKNLKTEIFNMPFTLSLPKDLISSENITENPLNYFLVPDVINKPIYFFNKNDRAKFDTYLSTPIRSLMKNLYDPKN